MLKNDRIWKKGSHDGTLEKKGIKYKCIYNFCEDQKLLLYFFPFSFYFLCIYLWIFCYYIFSLNYYFYFAKNPK